MVNSLNIKFDGNNKGIYHPNDVVAVSVDLKLDKLIKKAKGLRLSIVGVGSSKWTEGGGRSSVTYQGEHFVLNSVSYLFGKENSEPVEIASGMHSYKYSIKLSPNSPASVEGKHGFIRYKAAVNLDIPYMPDMNSEILFEVVRFEDLNLYSELRIASEAEEVKTFCCLFLETEPVIVKISTTKTGFIPGDSVLVNVEIHNRSSVAFNKSLISLNRVETYYSFTPLTKSRKVTLPITAAFGVGVEPKRTIKFQECLAIPTDVAISNDRFCKVFQITYEVKFFMKPINKSSSVQASVPVYIGTIALSRDSVASARSTSSTAWDNPNGDLPPFCKQGEIVSPAGTLMHPAKFDFVL